MAQNTIKANFLDIHTRKTYLAEVVYNETIVSINKLSDKCEEELSWVVPGFVDSHVHIESSMLSPIEFAKMVSKYGTIGAVCDPHEIANVCGDEGIDYMMSSAKNACMKLFFALPSCVPATSFETNGATVDDKTLDKYHDKVVALGEMMNYPGVVYGDKKVLSLINGAKKYDLPIDGHVPGLNGADLDKYISVGISTDHECFSYDEAVEKIEKGMKVLIREGSAARNLEALFPLLQSHVDDIMFCTDDSHPDDVLERGHISRFVDYAISRGVSLFDLYKPLLLTPNKHYRLGLGELRVGDKADFLVVDNLESYNVKRCIVDGRDSFFDDASDSTVNEKKCVNVKSNKDSKSGEYVNVFETREFEVVDFAVEKKSDKLRVIEVKDGELVSSQYIWQVNNRARFVEPSLTEDIVKIVVINRYDPGAEPAVGFIKGTGMSCECGAYGSSIAHDSHNVVIVGSDDWAIKDCANTLFANKGGLCVVDGENIESMQLPIGGLMTDSDYADVASKYSMIQGIIKEKLGVKLKAPFMTSSFMSLLVIPSLKLGDKGLFDVDKFEFVDLFV